MAFSGQPGMSGLPMVLADAGELFAAEEIDDPPATEGVLHHDHARMLGGDPADDRGAGRRGMILENF
jgi:hypothetical protein